jgi:DNA-binding MarR family transcriptional regulator
MHALTFEFKKLHLGAVGFGLKALADVAGMTPARFDLLFAIKSGDQGWSSLHTIRGWYSLLQSRITEALGLHASTVSKMITRLVALGWLAREEARSDKRRNIIRLTEAGHEAIKLAMRIVMKRRLFRRRFKPHFLPHADRHRCAERRTSVAMLTFYMKCEAIATRLGRGPTPLEWPPPYDPD